MAGKIKRENLGNHLFEYQLSLIGKTSEDAVNNKEWLEEWYLTEEQFKDFENYAIKTIQKVLKCNKQRAKSAFNWFDLGFGLKVKDGK